MTSIRFTAALAAAAIAVASVGLGGCVTLFPKTKPAQLYSFGGPIGATPPSQDAAQAAPVAMLRISYDFPRAADRDQILTRSGDGEAYIAGALWISPASVLFQEAARREFETANPPIRLLQGADNGAANMTLRLDVETFETDYPLGWKGAPTVVVRVRTLLFRANDHSPPLEGHFESRKTVEENRVGQIVGGYDAATADVLDQVVRWTTAHAG
jgi:cholesterol transport system auxiliary component